MSWTLLSGKGIGGFLTVMLQEKKFSYLLYLDKYLSQILCLYYFIYFLNHGSPKDAIRMYKKLLHLDKKIKNKKLDCNVRTLATQLTRYDTRLRTYEHYDPVFYFFFGSLFPGQTITLVKLFFLFHKYFIQTF